MKNALVAIEKLLNHTQSQAEAVKAFGCNVYMENKA